MDLSNASHSVVPVVPSKVGSWELKRLKALHREIIRQHILGLSNVEIAAKLGCTKQTVSNTLTSKVAREQIAVMQGVMDMGTMDIIEYMKHNSMPVVLEMEEMIEDPATPHAVRAGLMKDWLNRAGFAPVQKIATLHGELTSQDIEDIKNRAFGEAPDANDD